MKIFTGYSFRHSTGHQVEVMKRLMHCKYPVAPIADFCGTFGFVRWKKIAEKAGLRPMYGITLPVTASIEAKKPVHAEFTFYAKSNLIQINELLEVATSQFRYTPLLTYKQALEVTDALIIIGSNAALDEIAPSDNIFIGLSPSVSRGFFLKAKAAGHKFVATSENRYVNAGDRFLYETILGRNKNTQSYPQWILEDIEWHEAVKKSGATEEDRASACLNRSVFVEQCTATLSEGTLLSPEKPQTLHEMCVLAAPGLGVDLNDPVYKARLEREVELIYEKEFEDYFYIVGDMVRFAKKHMMVGGGRGSSSGSLVCYLLGITTIDPIPYDLLFERFIDINRGGFIWNKKFKNIMESICEDEE